MLSIVSQRWDVCWIFTIVSKSIRTPKSPSHILYISQSIHTGGGILVWTNVQPLRSYSSKLANGNITSATLQIKTNPSNHKQYTHCAKNLWFSHWILSNSRHKIAAVELLEKVSHCYNEHYHYVMPMYDDLFFSLCAALRLLFLCSSLIHAFLFEALNITIVIINYSFPLSQCLHVVCDMRCNFLRASLVITCDAFTSDILVSSMLNRFNPYRTNRTAEKFVKTKLHLDKK